MYNKKKKIKHKTLKIFFLLIGTIVTAVFLEAGILYLVNSQNVYKTSKVLLDQTIEIVEKNKQSEVRTVVADIPVYKGIALYVADKETGRIYGATDVSKIGVKLDDMGLRKQRKKTAKEKIASGIIRVDGKKNYYILKKTQKYIVGITYWIDGGLILIGWHSNRANLPWRISSGSSACARWTKENWRLCKPRDRRSCFRAMVCWASLKIFRTS